MSVITSNEFFINIKDKPYYDPHKHYFEQSKDAIDFYKEEFRKCKEGIYVGGVFIHPWLYFHLNFFKADLPVGKGIDKLMNPPLDDHIWYFMENYKEAEEKNKGLLIFGTRGFTKTTIIGSHINWVNTIKDTGVSTITGGSASDLKNISNVIQTGFNKIHPAMKLPRTTSDWDSHVEFGIKDKTHVKDLHSQIIITNTGTSTKKKKNEKGAGLTPIAAIFDEIGKLDFLNTYKTLEPAFKNEYGFRCVPILCGCLTEGNKVFTKNGSLVNIEDLKYEDGIVGYNRDKQVVSFEGIQNINPPQEKECLKITTQRGTVVECSYDHPFLIKQRLKTETYINEVGDKKRRRKLDFIEAIDLNKGDLICFPEKIKLKGSKEMKEDPYFIGAIIGGGNYSGDRGIRFYNEDKEIWDYLDSIGKSYDITKSYITQKGRHYKEVTFIGGIKYLKEIGIYGQTGNSKDLPLNIHSYIERDILELIAGLYDTGGYIQFIENNKNITFTTCSEKLLDSLKLLLIRLGIHSNKTFVKTDKRDRKIKSKNGYYVLLISDKESILNFCNKIPLKIKRKKENIEKLISFFKLKKNNRDSNYKGIVFDKIIQIEETGLKPVYNLTTDTTHTYLANGIITHNTGGNNELSSDARKVLQNPETHGMLPMNFERLNNQVDPEYRTWDSTKKFGTFVPGQMSYRLEGIKKDTKPLSEFLKIKDPKSALKDIPINVTNWKKATTFLKEELDRVRKDEDSYTKLRMYHPLNTDDCFATDSINPFPVKKAKETYDKLIEEGDFGKSVEILASGKHYEATFSNKKLASYPHEGGLADSPIVLYDEELPTSPPESNIFVTGLDHYKTDLSGTDSVGAAYTLKRRGLGIGKDVAPCETIVCSYAARPERMKFFNENLTNIVKAWNSKCLMESVDTSFKQHLDITNEAETYLAESISFSSLNSKKKKTKLNSKFGMYPNHGNNIYRMNLFIDYTKEEHVVDIDDEGNEIKKLGVEFIKDPYLLQEIIQYHPGANVDRIVAFSHALVWCRYLENMRVFPSTKNKDEEEYDSTPVKKVKVRKPSFYSTRTRRSMY